MTWYNSYIYKKYNGEIKMNDTILMLILLGVLVIAILYLIWEINFCLNTVIYTRQKKKMFKSLENILLTINEQISKSAQNL